MTNPPANPDDAAAPAEAPAAPVSAPPAADDAPAAADIPVADAPAAADDGPEEPDTIAVLARDLRDPVVGYPRQRVTLLLIAVLVILSFFVGVAYLLRDGMAPR